MKRRKLEHIEKSTFNTPNKYFETLEDEVFAKMTSEAFPLKNGFKSPEGYFDSIEGKVLEKLQLNDENKEAGFQVPKNYFQSVEDKVVKSIKKEPKVFNFKDVFLKRIIPIAAAASLLLFLFINYNKTTEVNLDQLASADIEQWIDDDLITFDTYEITDVFDDVELESQLIFDDEDVMDYFNGTDIESLIQEN